MKMIRIREATKDRGTLHTESLENGNHRDAQIGHGEGRRFSAVNTKMPKDLYASLLIIIPVRPMLVAFKM